MKSAKILNNVRLVNSNDVNKLINEVFKNDLKHPFELESKEEVGNNSYLLYNIGPKKEFDFEKKKYEELIYGREMEYYDELKTSDLLDILEHLGKLEEGYYLINVSW